MKAQRRLFEVPPAEFTAARNALVRELRDAGKVDQAKQIGAMRRPAATLWIANQLGPRHRPLVEALIEATRKLEKAQAGAGGDLREAMQEQRAALQDVMAKVDALAREIGSHVTPELQRRVQTTVTSAAASDPDSLLEGTLAHELEAAGFSELLGRAPAARAHTAAAAHHAPRAHADKPSDRTADKAAKAAEKRAEAAARRARAEHQRALARAEAEAKRLDHRARALEKKAAQTQAAADKARQAAADARERANAAASEALAFRQRSS